MPLPYAPTPVWWNDDAPNAWSRVRTALHRDLLQTKAHLGLATGEQLCQSALDTVLQAVGVESIPPEHVPNMASPIAMRDVEAEAFADEAARVGSFAAHAQWDMALDAALRNAWNRRPRARSWDAVRCLVRDRFLRARRIARP